MKVFVCCEGITDGEVLRCFIRKSSDVPDIEIRYETHSSIKSKKTYSAKKFNKYPDEQDARFDRIVYMKKIIWPRRIGRRRPYSLSSGCGTSGF
jgi:hypothetical protein